MRPLIRWWRLHIRTTGDRKKKEFRSILDGEKPKNVVENGRDIFPLDMLKDIRANDPIEFDCGTLRQLPPTDVIAVRQKPSPLFVKPRHQVLKTLTRSVIEDVSRILAIDEFRNIVHISFNGGTGKPFLAGFFV